MPFSRPVIRPTFFHCLAILITCLTKSPCFFDMTAPIRSLKFAPLPTNANKFVLNTGIATVNHHRRLGVGIGEEVVAVLHAVAVRVTGATISSGEGGDFGFCERPVINRDALDRPSLTFDGTRGYGVVLEKYERVGF